MKNNPSRKHGYTPLDDPEYVFTTYDLGMSAALVCVGFELFSLDKDNPRKALFVFKKQGGLEDAVNGYWSGCLEVKARVFFDTVKMLKNRLYSE